MCNDRKVIIPSEYNGKPVVAIGDSAFENDGFIKVVEIPNSVTSIGESAFYYCTSLTSVIIPDRVTSIGNCAFYICSLTSVNYLGTIDEWVQIEFAGDYSNPLCSAGNLYINGELVTEVELTTVTKISNYAFCNCDSLTSVVIGDSVTSIGNGAFSSCDSLTSVVIPDSVTSIGNGALSSCDSLTSVVIPDSVTSIGNSAFFFCDSLTSVNYLGTIDEWAQIELADRDSNPWCSAENLYINGELVTEVELTTATKISNYAFSGCDSLTSVVIPDSVTSIGDCAFCYCNSLTNIYCYAERQPNGWNGGWIANSNATVHWGYKGE